MPGAVVRASGLVPHAPARHVEPILDAVYAAECEVNYRIFSGLAAARAALSRQQREDGALCIDLGGGTTSWCAYRGLRPVALGALPVGGEHVTKDLLSAFNPGSLASAERFKRESGQASLRGIAADERVPLHPDLGDPDRTVSRRAAAQVVNARMSELFRLVREDLRRHDALRHLGAGIVLCGGGARLGGAAALAEEIFHAPCSLASFSTGCREIDADPVRNATIWGGLVQAVRKDEAEAEKMLRSLSGRWHEVLSGLSVYNPETGKKCTVSDITRVHFMDLDREMIAWYIATGDCVGAAGAYKIQSNGYRLIDKTEGSLSNIIGLPLEKLVSVLS